MKVLIGSTNPGKIEGAKKALENYYKDVEIVGVKVKSNVSDQPVNSDIYKGAKNRADNLIEYAKQNNINADLFMSIESGISNQIGKWIITNIAVIKNKEGFESVGTSASFPVRQNY